MIHFGELMRQVAPLFGYDPSRADRKGVARYRSRGSLRIDFRQGLFADYEAGEAGGVFDFIARETGEPPIEWLRRNHFEAPEPAARTSRRREEDHGAGRRELTAEDRDRIELVWSIWEAARPIDGIPEVAGYLASRRLSLTDTSQFRFHPKTAWRQAEGEPLQHRACLLVAFRNLDTDEITGLSRILVDEPERWPKTQRKMRGVIGRAAAKLMPVTDTLAVAEGVETAVAANMLGYGPAWALGSAGAVATLPVLPQIQRLILLEENNDPSRAAVECCGRRWLRAGRAVSRVLPDQGCDDLNDELIKRSH
jgi:hypothetical protein